MHPSALHHVELCVKNGKKIVSYFVDKMGFSVLALRETEQSRQWVIGSNKAVFVVTERKHQQNVFATETTHFTHFCCSDGPSHQVDSAFNVALEVKNVDLVTEKMKEIGGKVFQPVTIVEDQKGSVKYSIVGSCCGNVVHTLLDKSKYGGIFLPTFKDTSNHIKEEEPFTHIDHLTYVCHPGQSEGIIDWYQKCLGMKKFKTCTAEDLTEGLVIREGVGMRMRVMDYWPCAEMGVFNPNPDGMGDSSLKIVIGESLMSEQGRLFHHQNIWCIIIWQTNFPV